MKYACVTDKEDPAVVEAYDAESAAERYASDIESDGVAECDARVVYVRDPRTAEIHVFDVEVVMERNLEAHENYDDEPTASIVKELRAVEIGR